MNSARNRLRRFAAVASAILLVGAGAGHPVAAKAADGPMPCSAFQRNSGGAWRVLAPVTLNLGGQLYSPTVGTTFPAGGNQDGVEMSELLDQQCGNR